MSKELEEGSTCPCCNDGEMDYARDGECTCFISPPCPSCTDMKLTCDACGYQYDGN